MFLKMFNVATTKPKVITLLRLSSKAARIKYF